VREKAYGDAYALSLNDSLEGVMSIDDRLKWLEFFLEELNQAGAGDYAREILEKEHQRYYTAIVAHLRRLAFLSDAHNQARDWEGMAYLYFVVKDIHGRMEHDPRMQFPLSRDGSIMQEIAFNYDYPSRRRPAGNFVLPALSPLPETPVFWFPSENNKCILKIESELRK